MKKLFLLALVACMHNTAFSQQDRIQAVSAYLKVKDALVDSDATAVLVLTAELSAKVNVLIGYEALKKSVAALSAQKNLEGQRKAFAPVSSDIWSLVKTTQGHSRDLYYQYCPMKKTYWVSNEADIKNPYYGASMLKCGKVSDKKTR